MLREKNIILAARILSMLFTPFYLPMVGLIILFIFTYMAILPLGYKLYMLMFIYMFTVLMPSLLIHLYRRFQGWSPIELGHKERRIVPYIISILCYCGCFFYLEYRHVPRVLSIVLIAALLVQMACAFINIWWKISTHTAAIGGMAGALLAYAERFAFNPTWWLCLTLIIAGMVGSSRMILRQHSLAQVVVGFFVGLLCAYLII